MSLLLETALLLLSSSLRRQASGMVRAAAFSLERRRDICWVAGLLLVDKCKPLIREIILRPIFKFVIYIVVKKELL